MGSLAAHTTALCLVVRPPEKRRYHFVGRRNAHPWNQACQKIIPENSFTLNVNEGFWCFFLFQAAIYARCRPDDVDWLYQAHAFFGIA